MLEVLRAADKPLTAAQKRAFAREATRIFREILGTPPGRLRLFFIETAPVEQEDPGEDPPAFTGNQSARSE
jgi:hypothetical protein